MRNPSLLFPVLADLRDKRFNSFVTESWIRILPKLKRDYYSRGVNRERFRKVSIAIMAPGSIFSLSLVDWISMFSSKETKLTASESQLPSGTLSRIYPKIVQSSNIFHLSVANKSQVYLRSIEQDNFEASLPLAPSHILLGRQLVPGIPLTRVKYEERLPLPHQRFPQMLMDNPFLVSVKNIEDVFRLEMLPFIQQFKKGNSLASLNPPTLIPKFLSIIKKELRLFETYAQLETRFLSCQELYPACPDDAAGIPPSIMLKLLYEDPTVIKYAGAIIPVQKPLESETEMISSNVSTMVHEGRALANPFDGINHDR
jgi:hypothetical protein